MTARSLAVVLLGTAVANAVPIVTQLGAEFRYGQTFLTWSEAPVPRPLD